MRTLPLRHAVALGLLHGPTELLPVSSSAHTTLVPWLAGWPCAELDPALRKSFEVALHAGTAAALLVRPPWERQPPGGDERTGGLGDRARRGGARLGFILAAVTPAAAAGYALGERIERRLGTPATSAAGLLVGSTVMIAGELRARAGAEGVASAGTEKARGRAVADAGPWDGLALGLAQALALMPGISRSGATFSAARARGFSPRDADRLSWRVGLPVMAGATLLKGGRLAREGTPPGLRLSLAIGAMSSFLSTLASATVLTPKRRRALWPVCASYRVALALLVIRRMRDNTIQHTHLLKIKTSHKPRLAKAYSGV